jgi:16S rRNA (guanine527-N7)-methyltransferase
LDKLPNEFISLINIYTKNIYNDSLIKFWYILNKQNKFINLISRKTSFNDGFILHIIDSLTGLLFSWPENLLYLDIGSGGGLPAIPLKICNPGWRLTLVESTRKKANFLTETVSALGLEEVEVANIFLQNPSTYEASFDLITTRALATLSDTINLAGPLLKTGGFFMSYKGPNGPLELENSQTNLLKNNLKLVDTKEFLLPVLNIKRILYLFQKD